MNDKECWLRFEQTGAITDYLKFVACTSEAVNQDIEDATKNDFVGEGGVSGCSKHDRYGVVSNACRRL